MKHNLAPQARLFMATTFILFVGCLLLVAGFAPNAPVAFVAMSFVALLYRVGRRAILHRLGYREVPNRWANPDPLGPWIDRHLLRQSVTGETIRLDTYESDEVRHGR